MTMTIEEFISKTMTYAKECFAPKLTEEANKVAFGMKFYFAPKKIKKEFASPDAQGTIINADGLVDIDALEGAVMCGFEFGNKYPFLGICDLNKDDAIAYFNYLKGVAATEVTL